jgi:hypothetical protein
VFLIKQYIIHYNMQVHRICLSCLKLEHHQKYCFLLFNIYMYLFNLSIILKFDPYRGYKYSGFGHLKVKMATLTCWMVSAKPSDKKMATLTCWMVSAKPSDTIMKRNRHRTLKRMNRLKSNDNEWCQNKACHCHMVAGMIIQQRWSFLQKTILVSNSQFFLITLKLI